MAEISELEKKVKAGTPGAQQELDQRRARLEYLTKENAVGKSLMQQTDFAADVLKGIINSLKDEQIPDPNNPELMIDKYPDGKSDPDLLKEAFRRYAEFFQTVPQIEEAKADGGRIGLQMGGESMPADQGTTEEPKIDFATLRARLPKEIGDDIVKLIALSPEALEDFATIATQQDVDLFNQKYSVNLVLPQE